MSAKGWAYYHDSPEDEQRVACFSEAPLEHVHCLIGAIANGQELRECPLEPWGLAFTKMTARTLGINPVWYFDLANGGGGRIKSALRDLRALAEESDFANHPASRIFPFIEHMGRSNDGKRYEWWWEREWRHVGPVELPEDLAGIIWLRPEDADDVVDPRDGELLQPWIDPRWGLEEIIAHLAGFQPHDISPFVDPPPEPSESLPPRLLVDDLRLRRDSSRGLRTPGVM